MEIISVAQEEVLPNYTEIFMKRTWGKYPEIQKDHPYSDQCLEALCSKFTEWSMNYPQYSKTWQVNKNSVYYRMVSDIDKYVNQPGSNANKHWNNETQTAYKGSVSIPLSPTRFNINKSGLSATIKHEVTHARKGSKNGLRSS